MSKPLVTVLVVCYNHKKYVVDALNSVKEQTYKNLQILISDDCSSDGSASLINEWKAVNNNLNIEFLHHTQNKGLCKTLNELLRSAKGEFICMLGADDIIYPEKIEKQVGLFEKASPSVGIVYGDLNIIDGESKIIHHSFYNEHLKGEQPPSGNVFKYYIDFHPIHSVSVMIRRSVYLKVGYYDENLVFEDWDMGMRWARNFDYLYHNDIVGAYRKFAGQMTDVYWNNKEKFNKILEANFRMYKKHVDYPGYETRIFNNMVSIYSTLVNNKISNLSTLQSFSFSLFKVKKSVSNFILLSGSFLGLPKSSFLLLNRLNFFKKWFASIKL